MVEHLTVFRHVGFFLPAPLPSGEKAWPPYMNLAAGLLPCGNRPRPSSHCGFCRKGRVMGLLLLIVLIVLLVGGLPTWGHSRSWGYGPSSILGLLLVVLVILILMDRVQFRSF